MPTPVQAREAVHLLILQELARSPGSAGYVLKGGVNLRLFFGSVRYSEDMDLDGEPSARHSLRDTLRRVFTDRGVQARLRRLGIRGLDPGQGPNKDTETTFRYKFGVVGAGGIRYPTKVEVSFRERVGSDEIRMDTVAPNVIDLYAGPIEADLEVPHYLRPAALRQKLVALAERRLVQARDIFDLHLLQSPGSAPAHTDRALAYLRKAVPAEVLRRAHERVFDVSHDEYRGQVLEFLAPEARSGLADPERWDEIRLTVGSFIETILADAAEERS